MWFTETPWPPMVIFAVTAIFCGWMWWERRQSWWVVGAIGCVALTVGTWIFERSILTPGEQIEGHLHAMAEAFREGDRDELLSYISLRADRVRDYVDVGLFTVTEVEHLRITDTDVSLLAAGSRAKLHFRANGSFSIRGYGDAGHRATRWEMTWQQEGGLWKVIEIQRLDTITGAPIGLLHR